MRRKTGQSLRERVLARCEHIIATREPDFLIGPEDDPQTRRWYLTPPWMRRFFGIYLHEWCRSDADVPHDHPYLLNISWLLRIGYYEHLFHPVAARAAKAGALPDYRTDQVCFWRPPGSVIWHWGRTAHRVQLKTFKAIPIQGTTHIISEGMSAKGAVDRTPRPITIFVIIGRGWRE